jgi:hypothetical protein
LYEYGTSRQKECFSSNRKIPLALTRTHSESIIGGVISINSSPRSPSNEFSFNFPVEPPFRKEAVMKSRHFVSLFAASIFVCPPLPLTAAQSNPVSHSRQSPQITDNSILLPVVPYDAGGYISWNLTVADLNGDGKQDVVTVSTSGGPKNNGSVAVLLGNGDGTLQPPLSYDPGTNCSSPLSVAVGDLNGDGKLDVVTASSQCVAVFLGNGDGTLRSPVTYSTGGQQAFSGPALFNPVTIVDLNHDGKLDLVVLAPTTPQYGDGFVVVLLGKGDGTFKPSKSFDSGGFSASSFVIADFNGDGIDDLAVANCGPAGTQSCDVNDGVIGVLLGKGDGNFQAAKLYDSGGAGDPGSPLLAADLNGDGKADLVVGNSCLNSCHGGEDSTIGILLGKGDGTFQPTAQYDSGGCCVSYMTLVDVDQDGKLDIVEATGSINVLRGNGDGTFLPVERYPNGWGAVSVADLNGDGKPDLIVANITSNNVAVMLGNGSGFSGPWFFDSGGIGIVNNLTVTDLKGDGTPDVATVNWCNEKKTCRAGGNEEGSVGVLLNNPAFINNGTITTVASNANPGIPNQPVTFTAAVKSLSGATPTGNVAFYQGLDNIGDATLTNNQASITVQFNKTGDYFVQAIYSGDANSAGSGSLNFEQQIKSRISTCCVTQPAHNY